MQSKSAITSFFMTVTDIQENRHVITEFFSSLLELQLSESRVREKYSDGHFIVTRHPSNDQVRSSELIDVYHQARMQSLILHGIRNPQAR